jgi:hypothetical protein
MGVVKWVAAIAGSVIATLIAQELIESGAGSAAASAWVEPAGGPGCRETNEVVIAENGLVQVVGERSGEKFLDVFGCLKETGERRKFDTACDCGAAVHRVKIRATLVAFEESGQLEEEPPFKNLAIIDLRDGTSFGVDGLSRLGRVFGRFGIRANGSIAYIMRNDGRRRWEVKKCERGTCLGRSDARPTRLDTHAGVDPDYLKISGERVRWRRNGSVRSAPLR